MYDRERLFIHGKNNEAAVGIDKALGNKASTIWVNYKWEEIDAALRNTVTKALRQFDGKWHCTLADTVKSMRWIAIYNEK